MGACSYLDCRNRSEDGYQMCKFPRNPNRRKIWLANCKNKIKNPESPHIVLCQTHFEEKMWCPFGPRNHRLKPDAVPTIFGKLVSVNSNTSNSFEESLKHSDEAIMPTNEVSMQPRETTKQSNEASMQPEETMEHSSEASMQPEDTSKHSDEVNMHPDEASMQPEETTKHSSEASMQTEDTSKHSDEASMQTNEVSMQSYTTMRAQVDTLELQDITPLRMSQQDILNLIKKFRENEKKIIEKDEEMKRKEIQFKEKEEEMKKKLEIAEKLLTKEMKSKINLKRKYDVCSKRLQAVEKKVSQVEELENNIRAKLSRIFNKDQIDAICYNFKKYPKWSNETLMLGYRLRFSCGSSGYQQLLKENWPLPSTRTLTRKVENFKFPSGQLNQEVVDFLKLKIGVLKDIHKHSLLLLDEMSITPIITYDTSTKTMIGHVTLRDKKLSKNEKATHALVFMLAGLCARWKQSVRYEFTGDSVDEHVLKDIIIDIIVTVETKCKLLVHVITSDMGPVNQALWRIYNITAHRHKKTINSISHPVDPQRKLFFYADVPHALKNMNSGLQANEKATLPKKFVDKYNLPTNQFKIQHLFDIVRVDKENDYKLSPKLKQEHLQINSDHFKKMRVGDSRAVLSESNASALQFLAYDDEQDERLSTAQFVLVISKWFEAMCSNNINLAFSHKDMIAFQKKINFLKEFMELISDLRVGESGYWKPWQTGVIISTTTVLELTEYLLSQGVTYFVAARLTQNCLENLFSVMRSKNVIPNALQFKQNLKLICISQYMKTTKNSNYDEDDRSFLSGFLDILLKNRSVESNFLTNNAEEFIVVDPLPITYLNSSELNAFYYCAGSQR